MSRGKQYALAVALICLAAVCVGMALASRPRNFHVVREGVLYRSGQLSPASLSRILDDHRIRTVVSLRPVRDGEDSSDAWEEDICRDRGVRHIRIPPAEKGVSDPLAPVVLAFLELMDDRANHPVLVHCMAGRDRTGVMRAVFRIEFDGWTPDRALEEMRIGGFDAEKDAAAAAYAGFVRHYKSRAARRD